MDLKNLKPLPVQPNTLTVRDYTTELAIAGHGVIREGVPFGEWHTSECGHEIVAPGEIAHETIDEQVAPVFTPAAALAAIDKISPMPEKSGAELRAFVLELTGGETPDTERFVLWLERTDPTLYHAYKYVPNPQRDGTANTRAGELHIDVPTPPTEATGADDV